jgi:hypothetical protein
VAVSRNGTKGVSTADYASSLQRTCLRARHDSQVSATSGYPRLTDQYKHAPIDGDFPLVSNSVSGAPDVLLASPAVSRLTTESGEIFRSRGRREFPSSG